VLAADKCSAALRHEIAFILGQMEFTNENDGLAPAGEGIEEGNGKGGTAENVAVTALISNLKTSDEHPMV